VPATSVTSSGVALLCLCGSTCSEASPAWSLAAVLVDALVPSSTALQPACLCTHPSSTNPCRRVFAPKMGGLSATSASLQHQPVASLALFSSVASLLGAAGQVSMVLEHSKGQQLRIQPRCRYRQVEQCRLHALHTAIPSSVPLLQANYAAANAALDAWSHAWQAAGGASTSVQWGAWASSGAFNEHHQTVLVYCA